MSLRFIYGKSGTGKTTYCFNEIKKIINKNNKIYIITPEQFSFTAEKNLMDVCNNGASIYAEVITFNRLAFRILNEIGRSNLNSISECGKAMLVYNIIEKNKEKLNYINRNDRNLDIVLRMITELKKNNISTNILEEKIHDIDQKNVKLKLEDINTIYSEYESKIKNSYLDDDDILTIVKDKINESNMFKDSYIFIDEFSGFTKQEYSIIEELLKCARQVNITMCTDNMEQYVNKESDIFNQNKLAMLNIIDIAEKNNIKIEESIKLDKEYRYKNEELKFLSNNLYSINSNKYNKELEHIKLFLANNNYSEIEYVANNIIELVREKGLRYRDIAVITKNIDDYDILIKAIFKKYGIPVFIDENKELNQNILIQYILDILEVFSKNWKQEAIINYAKSGFISDISIEDIYMFENYCKKYGINGYKKFINTWEITSNESEDLNKLNNIKDKIIIPLSKFKHNLSKNKTVEDITKTLYDFLVENNIKDILEEKVKELELKGNIELANIYTSSWDLVIDILDELVLILGKEQINFDEYINIIKTGFNNASLGKIPATLDEVSVGNVDRSRSSKKKVIFIIGLNDGKFPSTNKNEGFINDEERVYLKDKKIELAKTTKEQMYDDNFNIYKAFGTAEEELFLSYTASDNEGKGTRKSVLINKIKKIFPKLYEESDIINKKTYISSKDITFDNLLLEMRKFLNGEEIDNTWFDIYQVYNNDEEYKEKLNEALNGFYYNNIADNISDENLEKLYGNTLFTSISKLESYKRCPFSYYLKYGLKLSDRDELKVERLDTGTFMHDVIDSFFEYLNNNNINVKEIEETEIERIVYQIINEKLKLKQNYIFNTIPKYIILTKRLKVVITRAIKYIVNSLKYSDFKVLGTEVEFGKGKEFEPIKLKLNDGKKVEIIGKIDRIDIAESKDGKFLRIIDYKSSVKKVDLNEVVAGIQIQLLTYVDAVAKKENADISGTLYFSLIEPTIKSKSKYLSEEQIEEEIRKNFKMDGLILGNVDVVKMMDNTLKSGESKIISAALDKEGNLKNKSNILQKDEFKLLQTKVEQTIKQISEEILSGNIMQKPVYSMKNKSTTCKFCNYKSICGFDSKMCNNTYNFIPNFKKEEILNSLKPKNK